MFRRIWKRSSNSILCLFIVALVLQALPPALLVKAAETTDIGATEVVDGDSFETFASAEGAAVGITELMSKPYAHSSLDFLDEDVLYPKMSSNGRYLVFQSASHEIVPGDIQPEGMGIYRVDLESGDVDLVSTDSSGVPFSGCSTRTNDLGKGNLLPTVSNDGKVAFISNCTSASDSSTSYGVYVKDLTTKPGMTIQVNRNSAGEILKTSNTAGYLSNERPSLNKAAVISAEGNHVLFVSTATNAAYGEPIEFGKLENLYVKDLKDGTLTKVSNAYKDVTEEINEIDMGTFYRPDLPYQISADGKTVVYSADDRGREGVFQVSGIYVYESGTITAVSDSLLTLGFDYLHGIYTKPSISSDGRYVAFEWMRRVGGGVVRQEIFVYDRQLDTWVQSPFDIFQGNTGRRSFRNIAVSDGGRYVAFETDYDGIVADDDNNASDIFRWDTETGLVTMISAAPDGSASDEDSVSPSISADGSVIVYSSKATNLTNVTTPGNSLVYLTSFDMESPTWSTSDLTVTQVGPSRATLSWPAATGAVESYRIYQDDTLLEEVDATVLSYLAEGLTPETTYDFRVEAGNASGVWSVDGPTASVTTTVIPGDDELIRLSAIAKTGGSVDLIWDVTTDSDVIGYRIHGSASGTADITVDIPDTHVGTYKIEQLNADTLYTFQVFTLDADNAEQPYTEQATITTMAITIGDMDWSAIFTKQREIQLGSTFQMTAIGEPNRQVTAEVHYMTREAGDGSMQDTVHAEQLSVVFTESATEAGTYAGSFEVKEGMTEITSVQVTLTDPSGAGITEDLADLPAQVSGILKVEIPDPPGDSLILQNAKLSIWSEQAGGTNLTIPGAGTYEFYDLRASDDYTITLRGAVEGLEQTVNSLETVSIDHGISQTIELSVEMTPLIVSLHGTDPMGNSFVNQVVNFYNNDTGHYIGKGEFNENGDLEYNFGLFNYGSTFNIRVESGSDVRSPYAKTVQVFSHTVGSNDVLPFTMNMIDGWEQQGTMSGQVFDEVNHRALEHATVFVKDADSDWKTTVHADENGRFGPIQVPAGELTVTARFDQSYAIEEKLVTMSNSGSLDIQLDADELEAYYISTNELRYRYFGDEWTTVPSVSQEMAANLKFKVEVDGRYYHVKHQLLLSSSYPIKIWAKKGDQLKACISNSKLLSQCKTFTLGDTNKIAVSFEIDQQMAARVIGNMQFSNGDKLKDPSVLLMRNSRIVDRLFGAGYFDFPIAEPGDYNLQASAWDHDGNMVTSDVPFYVEAGGITDMGTIMLNPVGMFAGKEENSFVSLDRLVTEGESITYRASYSSNNIEVADAILLLDIPVGTHLIPETVSHNGQSAAYTVQDQVLSIALGDLDNGMKGNVRYTVQLDDGDLNLDSLHAQALIRFQHNGTEKTEILGTTVVDMSAVTLYAPQRVDETQFIVHGRALPNQSVEIVDQSGLLALTDASSGGYWRTEVTLDGTRSPSWHELQAIVEQNEQTYTSRTVDVLYDQDQPKLEELWISQDFTGNGMESTDEEYTKVSVENQIPRFPMLAFTFYPFEIKLKFNHPEKVSNVRVWIQGTHDVPVEAILQDDGMYYAKVEQLMSAYPGDIFVDYDVADFYPKLADEFEWQSPQSSVEDRTMDPEFGLGEQDQEAPVMFRSAAEELSITSSIVGKSDDFDTTINTQLSTGYTSTTSTSATIRTPFGTESISNSFLPGSHSFELDWDMTTSRFNVDVSDYLSNLLIGTSSSGSSKLYLKGFSLDVGAIIPIDEFVKRDRHAPWWEDDAEIVTGELQDGKLTLSWTPAMDDLWANTYRIYQDGAIIAEIAGSQLSYTVTGITNGQSYNFQVEAVDPAGKMTMGPSKDIVAGVTAGLTPSQLETYAYEAKLLENETSRSFRAAAAGSAVKTAIDVVGVLSAGVDGYALGTDFNDAMDQNEKFDKMEELMDSCGPPTPARVNAKMKIHEAREALLMNHFVGSFGLGAGVAMSASGIGIVAGAVVTVASLAASEMTEVAEKQAIDLAEEAFENFLAAAPECEEEDDDEKRDMPNRPIASPAWKLDPSGYVYEVVEDNRLQGVTATILFREDPSDDWTVWDAEWWGEVNPQSTDILGRYAWDVPKGQWQVVYEKEGYVTEYSYVMDVPPEHFDVNQPLITTQAPHVNNVHAYEGEGILIEFDQYVKISTLTTDTYGITNAEDASPVLGTLTAVDLVSDTDGDEVARTFKFVPESALTLGETYDIELRGLIQNYADIPMWDDYTTTVTVTEAPPEPEPEDEGTDPDEGTEPDDESGSDDGTDPDDGTTPDDGDGSGDGTGKEPDDSVDEPVETGTGWPGSIYFPIDPIDEVDQAAFQMILTGELQEVEAFEGDIQIHIPAGLFSQGDVLHIERMGDDASDKLPFPEDHHVYSPVYHVYVVKQNGETVTTSSVIPSQIMMDITMSVNRPNGLDERKLSVYHLSAMEATSVKPEWHYEGGVTKEGTVTVRIDDMSNGYYAVMAYDKTFADLQGHWSQGDVEVLISRHIVHGVNADKFQPNRNITRAEMTQLLVVALGLNSGESQQAGNDGSPFEDVVANAWYAEPIRLAFEHHIIAGYNGQFRPNDTVTREEMAIMLTQAFEINVNQQESLPSGWGLFLDTDDISPWAENALKALYAQGFISGMSDTRLAAGESATRAQAAVMILRIIGFEELK